MQFDNSLRDILRKTLDTPFLPLLFISKAIEEAVYWKFVDGTAEPVIAMGMLGIIALIAWVTIDEVAEEVADEVA
jgi:hypothetical protein